MTLLDKFIDYAMEQAQQHKNDAVIAEMPKVKHVLISGNGLYYLNITGDLLFTIDLELNDEAIPLLS